MTSELLISYFVGELLELNCVIIICFEEYFEKWENFNGKPSNICVCAYCLMFSVRSYCAVYHCVEPGIARVLEDTVSSSANL